MPLAERVVVARLQKPAVLSIWRRRVMCASDGRITRALCVHQMGGSRPTWGQTWKSQPADIDFRFWGKRRHPSNVRRLPRMTRLRHCQQRASISASSSSEESCRPRMVLIRTTVAALVAFAVAFLPASGNAIVLPSQVQVAMTDQADMPCCPSYNTHGDFKATDCVLKCAALASAVLPVMSVAALLYVSDGAPLALAEDVLHGLVRAPPTHPPPA